MGVRCTSKPAASTAFGLVMVSVRGGPAAKPMLLTLPLVLLALDVWPLARIKQADDAEPAPVWHGRERVNSARWCWRRCHWWLYAHLRQRQ